MMRQPARTNRRRVQTAVTRSVPAPTRGWNARDSIAAMHPQDAVLMDNWWPNVSTVDLRPGSAEHVTKVGDPVETLIAYKPESGLQELFAFAGDSLFDVSAPGEADTALLTGLTNAQWQCQNVGTSGGNYLLCVNGADDLLLYDGAAWAAIDDNTSPAITGVATSDLINLFTHKERVFFIEKNSLNAWYTAAGQITGSVSQLPLQGVFKKGGYLVAGGTWTLDGGSGIDDLAVFVTSEGEAAVYQGIDPTDADKWALVGVFAIGKPIGYRCMEKLGGDLLIHTTDGVVPASRAFVSARADKAVAITDRIQGAMARAAAQLAQVAGWQLKFYPEGSALILNVPVAEGQEQQFVMNTVTKAWTRFTGWPARCFEEFNGRLYFGTADEVRQAWTGTADMGERIQAELVPAFNYFGDRGSKKHFTLVQPLIAWDANPAIIRLGVDVDFELRTPTSEVSLPGSAGAVWDDADWDAADWAGDPTLKTAWYTALSEGYAGALHLLVYSKAARLSLSAINYVFKPGAAF